METTDQKIRLLEEAIGTRFGDGVVSLACYAEDENDSMLRPAAMPEFEQTEMDDGEICAQLNAVFPCPEGGAFKAHFLFPRRMLAMLIAMLLKADDDAAHTATRN